MERDSKWIIKQLAESGYALVLADRSRYRFRKGGAVYTMPHEQLSDFWKEVQSKAIKRTPSKAALAARATTGSDDIFAGRTVRQGGSDTQQLPLGDKRYRIRHSEKFYVVQLVSGWVNITESAERTVIYRNRLRYVRFENCQYELRKADAFYAFVGRFIDLGCYAYVGGQYIDTVKGLRKTIPQPFIYIASAEALRRLQSLRRD